MSRPDAASETATLVRMRFPGLRFDHARVVTDGWDSLVVELDGAWIVRLPRRPEVGEWIEKELRLLSELAPCLPVAIPRFELVSRDGLVCVVYRSIHGSPARAGIDGRTGRDLGRFLEALHGFPAERARALGVPSFDPAAWRERLESVCDEFRSRVAPLLDPADRRRAEPTLVGVTELEFTPVLVHADLGPAHVLCEEGRVVGVIDWSDARVGDPALDLAWCLHGTPAPVAEGVAHEYRVDAELRRRSLLYHRLGPWYEAAHGLDVGDRSLVASGLDGIRARLPHPP